MWYFKGRFYLFVSHNVLIFSSASPSMRQLLTLLIALSDLKSFGADFTVGFTPSLDTNTDRKTPERFIALD